MAVDEAGRRRQAPRACSARPKPRRRAHTSPEPSPQTDRHSKHRTEPKPDAPARAASRSLQTPKLPRPQTPGPGPPLPALDGWSTGPASECVRASLGQPFPTHTCTHGDRDLSSSPRLASAGFVQQRPHPPVTSSCPGGTTSFPFWHPDPPWTSDLGPHLADSTLPVPVPRTGPFSLAGGGQGTVHSWHPTAPGTRTATPRGTG